jgi:hypothetical protein
MDSVRQDLVQAFRAMTRQKGFTIAALLSMALGIGWNAELARAAGDEALPAARSGRRLVELAPRQDLRVVVAPQTPMS